jgi:hypothetical protein
MDCPMKIEGYKRPSLQKTFISIEHAFGGNFVVLSLDNNVL